MLCFPAARPDVFNAHRKLETSSNCRRHAKIDAHIAGALPQLWGGSGTVFGAALRSRRRREKASAPDDDRSVPRYGPGAHRNCRQPLPMIVNDNRDSDICGSRDSDTSGVSLSPTGLGAGHRTRGLMNRPQPVFEAPSAGPPSDGRRCPSAQVHPACLRHRHILKPHTFRCNEGRRKDLPGGQSTAAWTQSANSSMRISVGRSVCQARRMAAVTSLRLCGSATAMP